MDDTCFRAAIGPATVAQLGRLGVTGLGCVPLRVGPEVIGAMTLGRGHDGDPLDGDDLALIAEVADRAGLAIENARLYALQLESQQELARSAQRATVLAGVSQALAAADPEPDAVCDTAARLLVRDVGDTCVIMLASPGTPELRLATVRSREPDAATLYRSLYAVRPRRLDDSGPVSRVFATGKPVLLPEPGPHPSGWDRPPEDPSVRLRCFRPPGSCSIGTCRSARPACRCAPARSRPTTPRRSRPAPGAGRRTTAPNPTASPGERSPADQRLTTRLNVSMRFAAATAAARG